MVFTTHYSNYKGAIYRCVIYKVKNLSKKIKGHSREYLKQKKIEKREKSFYQSTLYHVLWLVPGLSVLQFLIGVATDMKALFHMLFQSGFYWLRMYTYSF